MKGSELNSLQCALFQPQPDKLQKALKTDWPDNKLEVWSNTSRTVSGSLDSVSGGECEMAPHSPQRAGQGAPPPPPYAAPPPPYQPQWPVAPPNVYVSQVTANVNVHGYMGQYYQPQYERQPRPPRRTPRTKRGVSPPTQPPPYYVQYPPYYSAAQAQGTPLYHMPMYQPVTYLGHYPYHHYYSDYQMSVEGDGTDKGPEEYPQEVLMEQEAVEAYYAGAHYGGPSYGAPVEGPVEYMPPTMYLPPPQHQHPLQMAPQHAHQPPPHQFNVHAKNFVQNQHHNKAFSPPDKSHEQRSPTRATSVSAASSVENLPMKELKIGKGPNSQGPDHTLENNQPKPSTSQSERVSPKMEMPKQSWSPSEVKAPEPVAHPPVKNFSTNLPNASVNQAGPNKATTATVKVSKTLTTPFPGNKSQPSKPSIPTSAMPVQQNVSIPKAPFGNRQKRDGPATRSPSNEVSESTEKPLMVDHSKREPLLPPSKAPMPISITLHSQGQPLIVSNKTPFSHARKSLPAPEPVPQPPPPAPTASDFPPPPTPRNRGDPLSTTTTSPVIPQQPAPGKSWASLFSNKSTIGSSSVSLSVTEEPTSPTSVNTPMANVKPVAKVPPFDASPLLQSQVDRPKPMMPPTGISYSEKTSVNAMSNNATPVKSASPTTSEVREIPVQKEQTPAQAAQASAYAEDPNSYRMGDFLSKYQLDHKSVMLLPRGLTNRSNYCYVNAILQALIACPPFYNMLKALPYQTRRGKSSTPVIDAMVELCYEFTPLPPNARVSRTRATESTAGGLPIQTGPPLDPAAGQKVLRALRPFPGSQEGRQEDAEEFLSCLLNGLNDEMLELIKVVEPEEPKDSQTNGIITQEPVPVDEDDDDWKVMGPRNRGAVERQGCTRRTPLSDIFRGRTRCRTHRATAHDVTDAVQPFFTLQLDIERSTNVKDALELLAGKDALEGVSDAWQQLSIEQPPIVLLLHLKCFQLDSEGHTAKIVKNIDFPIELKIDPKVMSQKAKVTTKQRLYKLFAVVYHEGIEAVKGHYLTDTYHGQAGWIRYDDSTVTLVSESQVLKPKPSKMPYILMYRRQDMIPMSHRNVPKTE